MTSTSARRSLTKADFTVPALLLALSFVPMIGGVVRVLSVARDVTLTADNARFRAHSDCEKRLGSRLCCHRSSPPSPLSAALSRW